MGAGNAMDNAHSSCGFELALRVLRWADRLNETPSAASICSEWGVSRATAYRWRAALSAAMAENWKPRLAL
jgi:hypothetical protein